MKKPIILSASPLSPEQKKKLSETRAALQQSVAALQENLNGVVKNQARLVAIGEERQKAIAKVVATADRAAIREDSALRQEVSAVESLIADLENSQENLRRAILPALDAADHLIHDLAAPLGDKLIDQIAVEIAPCFSTYATARGTARTSDAVRVMGGVINPNRGLLRAATTERIFAITDDALGKLQAFETGGEIFRFIGAEIPTIPQRSSGAV